MEDCFHKMEDWRVRGGRQERESRADEISFSFHHYQTRIWITHTPIQGTSSSSHVWMWELDYKESWAPNNWCFWTVVLEKTLESPLDCKEIQPVHLKGDQSWVFIGKWCWSQYSNTLAIRFEELTHLKRSWCWEWLKAGEGADRGWDGWMASPTQWTWVWASSRSWWWTGRPSMLQSMGLQRVKHNLVTELNWRE